MKPEFKHLTEAQQSELKGLEFVTPETSLKPGDIVLTVMDSPNHSHKTLGAVYVIKDGEFTFGGHEWEDEARKYGAGTASGAHGLIDQVERMTRNYPVLSFKVRDGKPWKPLHRYNGPRPGNRAYDLMC